MPNFFSPGVFIVRVPDALPDRKMISVNFGLVKAKAYRINKLKKKGRGKGANSTKTKEKMDEAVIRGITRGSYIVE